METLLTLCIIHKDPRVLLGMKKRGFGAGRWNGFGGKVKMGETIEEAALREVEEETGVRAKELEKLGVINFQFRGKPGTLNVHVFKCVEFEGEPEESEEMKPQWFHIDDIPFQEMWADDIHWMPLFLESKKFSGSFLFDEYDKILKMDIQEDKK